MHFSVKRKSILILLAQLITFKTGKAQSFFDLPKSEKIWVIKHPIAALKAKKTTRTTLIKIDSLMLSIHLDTFFCGGKSDAYRHIYWMYRLTKSIGGRKARSLGIANEKGNYQQFKRKQLEDGLRPDSLSSVMDLFNNDLGIALALNARMDNETLIKNIFALIQDGKAIMLKRNGSDYVNCKGEIIDIGLYKTKWFIPYCIIKTNGTFN